MMNNGHPYRLVARTVMILKQVGLLVDRGDWLESGRILACAYPRSEQALDNLARQGVTVLLNLHERAHDPLRLASYGFREVHVPVRDFTAPSAAQLEKALTTITQSVDGGHVIAVHCGGGLGRTGTVLACYLVQQGWTSQDAIDQVRTIRPGSVETRAQVAAVHAYWTCLEQAI
jgi:atypical dual specificity phosphatase